MNLKYIKEYWNNSAIKSKINSNIAPTSRDPYLANLERNFIISCLKKKYYCLEIGCGDALNTFYYKEKVKYLLATDNSENLLKIANKKLKKNKVKNLDFMQLSALDINESFINEFDCIISQRCIINLGTWKNQKKTIKDIHKSLKKNGSFVLTEGFSNRLENLNKLRKDYNLQSIKVAKYNNFLDEKKFEKYIKKYFKINKIYNYGTYTILSHLFHPLAIFPKNPKHDSLINKTAMQFQNNELLNSDILKKYSYNLGYELIKK